MGIAFCVEAEVPEEWRRRRRRRRSRGRGVGGRWVAAARSGAAAAEVMGYCCRPRSSSSDQQPDPTAKMDKN